MPTHSIHDGSPERHGIRAVIRNGTAERVAQIWRITAAGIVKIYESIRSCYGSGRWRYGKMYRYGDRWRYGKAPKASNPNPQN